MTRTRPSAAFRFVVVAPAGRPNQVLYGESCGRFDVNVVRTDTNINEIWAVDGRLTLQCPELAGSVTFEGYH